MNRNEYMRTAFELYNSGEITAEVYDAMILNADAFCDGEEGTL